MLPDITFKVVLLLDWPIPPSYALLNYQHLIIVSAFFHALDRFICKALNITLYIALYALHSVSLTLWLFQIFEFNVLWQTLERLY